MTNVSSYSIKFIALFAVFVMAFSLKTYAQEKEQQMKPEATEVWQPVPPKVTPGEGNAPPSDAIVLFDGNDLSKWEGADGGPAQWTVEGDHFTIKPGTGIIKTKQKFGDVQLHIEWRTPSKVEGEGQGRGNSGIFLQGRYELQVLDSYNNRTYSNGMAGSIYKQYVPQVNPTRGPGKWQAYDIIFKAPKFDDDGTLESPARETVFLNGVLIQYNVRIKGPTEYIGLPKYKAHAPKQPLVLQDHHNPDSYRNIWIREIDLDVN